MKKGINFRFAIASSLGLVILLVAVVGWDNLKLRLSRFRGITTIENNPLLPGLDKDLSEAESTKQPRISPEYLLSGGVGKDDIPAIDEPIFDTRETTPYSEQEWVLGVEIEGEARAYPYAILNWHEIVNDQIQDKAFSVTYCPLCDTGIIFDRTINGESTTFGVSGKLYNNCLVMYDRKTNTLWNQPWGTGVVGENVNKTLERIPVTKTTLGNWLKTYPGSKILSPNTGHDRNYFRYPYGDYFTSGRLIFPTTRKLPGDIHPKTLIQYAWKVGEEDPLNTFYGESAYVILDELKIKGWQTKPFGDDDVLFWFDKELESAKAFLLKEEIQGLEEDYIITNKGEKKNLSTLQELPTSSSFSFVYFTHFRSSPSSQQ